MTKAIPSVSASSKHGTKSVSARAGSRSRQQQSPPAGTTEIGDYIAGIQTDPILKMQLAAAQAWLAHSVFPQELDTIRTLRLRMGLSQAQLAQAMGTKQPHIARIEKGAETLSIATCRKLCSVLGVDMNTLDALLQRQEANTNLHSIFGQKAAITSIQSE